jgi:hypothetical protein
MRIFLSSGLVVSSLIGCVASDPADSREPEQETLQVAAPPATPAASSQMPTLSGTFKGGYVVPTTSNPNLASAASFAVPEVSWTVVSRGVTLHYDLPVGLVGGDVSVTLTGTLASGTVTNLTLTSGSGTGGCTAQGNIVSCSESFNGLGAMPVSTAVVQSTATQDSVAPASRVAVANLFGIDPIGTVTFDISQPVDDHGGGKGGGHGHGGGGGGGDD